MGKGTTQLFNLQWLEENLGYAWTSVENDACHDVWDNTEGRMIHSYPSQAYLLIVRDYIVGMDSKTEERLRELIPVLSQLGDFSLTLSALVLLGIFVMETGPKTDLVDTILEQVTPELSLQYRSMPDVLYRYLQGQIAVKAARLADADEHYASLIAEPLSLYEPLNFLLGRIYQKIGVYVLREPRHDLEQQWRFRVGEWCARYRDTVIAQQLLWLCQSHPADDQHVHPVVAWQMENPPLFTHQSCSNFPETCLNFRELEVIRTLVTSRFQPSVESCAKARIMAEAYGDPFWVQQAEQCQLPSIKASVQAPRTRPSIELEEPSLNFTYFHTFQGYTSTNTVLFPPTYNRHKVRLLLALILLQPRFRIVKDQLMVHLFGDDQKESEGNYLHVTLHRLRQLLFKSTGLGTDWITVRDGMVVLNERRINRVDVEEYRKMAAVGHELWRVDREAACDLYARAVTIYHPVIAPEFEYEDWMVDTRIFLHQQQRRMLKRLWQEDRQAGKMDSAVQWGEQLLTLDSSDLSVLQDLCEDWKQMGEERTMQQTCLRVMEDLREEGERIPSWLKNSVQETYRDLKRH